MREFEQLVQAIEKALAGEGASVEWNEHIVDKSDGEPTQVDVVIRGALGTVPVLILVECRRHSRPQGKKWINELCTRRDDLGANTMVAVSASGFTEPARTKARVHGIELRTLREITPEAVQGWFTGTIHNTQVQTHSIADLEFILPAEVMKQNPTLDQAAYEELSKAPYRALFFRRADDREPVNIDWMLRVRDELGYPEWRAHLADDKHFRTLVLTFEPGMFWIPTSLGETALQGLIVTEEIKLSGVAPNISSPHRYEAADRGFAEVIEIDPMPGVPGSRKLRLIHDLESGVTKIGFSDHETS